MKRVSLLAMFMLMYVSQCAAQIDHFSVYVTQSLGTDNATIYQTVTLDGYAQVPSMPPSVVHTPHILNTLGSTGGWFTGPGTCATCTISFSNTEDIYDDQGDQIPTDIGAQVVCPFVGAFFSTGPSPFVVERAYTRVETVPPPSCSTNSGVTTCTIPVVAWCTAETSPPDFNTKTAAAVAVGGTPTFAPFYDGYAVCFRKNVVGTPWTCTPGVPIALAAPQLLANCTHNP